MKQQDGMREITRGEGKATGREAWVVGGNTEGIGKEHRVGEQMEREKNIGGAN